MSGAKIHQFVVYAPDYTTEGTLERRLKVRAQHLAGADQMYRDNLLQTGGGLLSVDGLESDDPASKLVGSMLIISAANIEEARKMVEADPYWKGDVWDKDRVAIHPFLQRKHE
ncbi:hypothetical protein M422DRAFT_150209 [Sphaerobolus stellatus SS14]|nr:hypothetical protein M422DRAFT_150209 [Sphaerobolus stellatus SS14]